MGRGPKYGTARVKSEQRRPRTGTGSAMTPPPLCDRPTASEIEAYYLSDSSLAPERQKIVKQFVTENYLDGGTRELFLARRKRTEQEIMAMLDDD